MQIMQSVCLSPGSLGIISGMHHGAPRISTISRMSYSSKQAYSFTEHYLKLPDGKKQDTFEEMQGHSNSKLLSRKKFKALADRKGNL